MFIFEPKNILNENLGWGWGSVKKSGTSARVPNPPALGQHTGAIYILKIYFNFNTFFVDLNFKSFQN